MVGIGQVDIEIDPLPLRGDFELPISPNVPEIRTDKNFGNIPIPELKCFR